MKTQIIVCVVGGQSPLRTLINEGTPTFVYLLFRPKGGLKAINDFSHFCGLIPDTHSKHLECFVKIGTHSELHRGQMSHICDISPPRVNYMFSELIYTSDNQWFCNITLSLEEMNYNIKNKTYYCIFCVFASWYQFLYSLHVIVIICTP